MSLDLHPDFAPNPSQRAPVVLVIDTSGSMAGSKIRELSSGLQAFHQTLKNDDTAALSVEVSLITFGPTVQQIHDFSTAFDFNLPKFEASGETPMGEALEFALTQLEARKCIYREHGIPYYRPWLVLITDGVPTDLEKVAQVATALKKAESKSKLSTFLIGVEGADMNILNQIAPPQRSPLMLKGLNFRELFLWLSASMQSISHSQGSQADISLPSPAGWAKVGVN